jgi:hypothetical protein
MWGALSHEGTGVVYSYRWALPAQSFSGPELLYFKLNCLIFESQNLEGQVSVFICPGTRWPSYTPGAKFAFGRHLRLPGLQWSYSNPRPRGDCQLTRPANNTSAGTKHKSHLPIALLLVTVAAITYQRSLFTEPIFQFCCIPVYFVVVA